MSAASEHRGMKIGNLSMVNRHVQAICVLERQRAGLRGLRVTIDGDVCDDAIVALVRPHVEQELKGRDYELRRDLAALGVDLG